MRTIRTSTPWARRELARSGSSAPPLPSPMPSITRPASVSATCRSRSTSSCHEIELIIYNAHSIVPTQLCYEHSFWLSEYALRLYHFTRSQISSLKGKRMKLLILGGTVFLGRHIVED